MRNKAITACISMFLFSCTPKNKYTLSITSTQESILGGQEEKTEKETIEANDDSSAYYQAIERFVISLRVADEMKKYKYNEVPLSFKVTNEKGEDIALQFSKDFTDRALAYQKGLILSHGPLVADKSSTDGIDSFAIQQQQIAFGDLKFGMTEKEVKKLIGDTWQERIGDYYYNYRRFYDHNGKLYKITFESNPQSATYIDTDVKSKLDNLYETVKSKYGDGEYVQPFPTILGFNPGYIKFTNRWHIGSKTIVVGAGEVSGGAEYYSFCNIYDEKMNEAEETFAKNQSDAVKKRDASKF